MVGEIYTFNEFMNANEGPFYHDRNSLEAFTKQNITS